MQNLIPSIGEIIQNGVRIGTVVQLTNMTIVMIIMITRPTIRSIFFKIDNESLNVGKGQANFRFPHFSTERSPPKDSKATCDFPWSRLPTAVGTVNGKEVRVLRDTGCTGVVVRRSLVSNDQMFNKQSGVTLINNYKQRCPVARITIDSPFLAVLQMHCALMI